MSVRVELADLSLVYPKVEIPSVDHLNLAIEAGSLFALLGPSGCGKTTTLKMIAGLLEPTHGEIAFDGRPVARIRPEQRNTAMVFQKPLLFPHMTIGQNVAFGLRMRHVAPATIRERVAQMLDLVRLPNVADRRPGELSGGQEQRISLARALVTNPAVLLLDEPLSQLDANLRLEMRDLIRQIQRELGVTTIFVTHDQEEAVMLADRIALMLGGQLLQVGKPSDFYERPDFDGGRPLLRRTQLHSRTRCRWAVRNSDRRFPVRACSPGGRDVDDDSSGGRHDRARTEFIYRESTEIHVPRNVATRLDRELR